jgi:hypothetical protein
VSTGLLGQDSGLGHVSEFTVSACGTAQAPAVSARRVPGLGVRLFHGVRLWLGHVLSPHEQ